MLAPAADGVDGHAPTGTLLTAVKDGSALIPDGLLWTLTLVPVLNAGARGAGQQLRGSSKAGDAARHKNE